MNDDIGMWCVGMTMMSGDVREGGRISCKGPRSGARELYIPFGYLVCKTECAVGRFSKQISRKTNFAPRKVLTQEPEVHPEQLRNCCGVIIGLSSSGNEEMRLRVE